MSFLSQFGTQLAVDALNEDISKPSGITSYALSIGSINLSIDDLPESLKLGGEQIVAVHKYPGGGLDVQTLGAFESPISWAATFMYTDSNGQSALDRCMNLNVLRVKGNPVTVTAGRISQKAVISKFSFTYMNDYRIPYEIELQPTEISSTQMASATNVESSLAKTSVLNQTVQQAVNAALGNSSTVVKNAVGQVLTKVTRSASGTTIGTILSDMALSNPKLALAGTLLAAVPEKTIHTVSAGENLFSIAQQAYGDGTLWPIIAQTNGINNPIAVAIGQRILVPKSPQ